MQNPVTRMKAFLRRLLRCARARYGNTATLQAQITALQNQLARIEGEIVDIGGGIDGLTHAFAVKPWPDLFDPFATQEIARRICRLGGMLTPGAVEGPRKIRVGHQYDGGYVMIDDWQGVRGAISIGIGDNDA